MHNTPQTEINEQFSLALELINQTNCNVFLTGNAGSGKTTFLHYLRNNTSKQKVVIAPTGVAAINAGGVTAHSFFQLPFQPYIGQQSFFGSTQANAINKTQFLSNIKLNKEKITIIKQLELLIIDEVSMLRADMLDAINDVLQYVKRNQLLFGGVQVLMIGDLYQLSPVVVEQEAGIFNSFYDSPFFFHANCLQQTPPLIVSFEKIYRQQDESFLKILNEIRNNNITQESLQLLNNRYVPDALSNVDDAVTLTTHNFQSNQINESQLKKLESPLHGFNCTVTGDFPEKNYPAESTLQLKVGARVMFIKNDNSGEKRFYNGKLVTITAIKNNEVWVKATEDHESFLVEPMTWENISYKINDETGLIEEDVIGSFTQLPLRLAWAITIHKSQGLTFNKLIVDTARAFAAGQVYVALSRCTSLEGIYLLKHVHQQQIISPMHVDGFLSDTLTASQILDILKIEKPIFAREQLNKTFTFDRLGSILFDLKNNANQKKLPDQQTVASYIGITLDAIKTLTEFANTFKEQLNKIFNQTPLDEALLTARVLAAKKYFAEQLHQKILFPLQEIILLLKDVKRVKAFTLLVQQAEAQTNVTIRSIEKIAYLDLNMDVTPLILNKVSIEPKASKVNIKGATFAETLHLLEQGKTIEEVAKIRNMAVGTIESHVARLIKEDKLELQQFVDSHTLELILSAAKKLKQVNLTNLKSVLPKEIGFGTLRIVQSAGLLGVDN